MERSGAMAAALDAAAASLAAGDAPGAERMVKAITAFVRAEQAVAAMHAAAPSQEEDEESRRAELRRRLARFVEADIADAPAEVLERIATQGSAQ